MHVILFFKFPFLENVNHVPTDIRFFTLKKYSHLTCCQPHGFILHTNIYLCLSVLGLINDNLIVLVHFTIFILFQIYTTKVTKYL